MKTFSKGMGARFSRLSSLFVAFLALFFLFSWNMGNGGGRYATNTVNAAADIGDAIEVSQYVVDMTILQNRKIEVQERITVRFLRSDLTSFCRSLPMDGARYSDIQASCEGNADFSYNVASNPDTDRMLDINCVGGVWKGGKWTYTIGYTMEQGTNTKQDGMIIDVVGFGWTVPLYDVQVTVHFPATPSGVSVADGYGNIMSALDENSFVQWEWTDDKTLRMAADVLELQTIGDEEVVRGITLEFALPTGTLRSYTQSRIFTDDLWYIALLAAAFLAASVALLFATRRRQEPIVVVNVKPPKGMDPLKMGKWLDGTADSEDVTSMLYYFANEGYLRIDLSDTDDPLLVSLVEELPPMVSVYEKTLFDGLFEKAERAEDGGMRQVRVSKMAGKFYESAQTAIKQVPPHPAMYKKRSVVGYVGGALLGFLVVLITPFLAGLRIGGGYRYFMGGFMLVPLAAVAFLGYVTENYRYKWKKGARVGMRLAQWAIALLASLLFIVFFAEFILTEFEKALICVATFGCCMITQSALSRTDEYLKALQDILGFKDFIVYTEADKLEEMLKIDPSLYYRVLPYAQVLGVTDVWEHKFEKLLVQPPVWSSGMDVTVFDYMLINRCMRRSMAQAWAHAASAAGGTRVSGLGGGGHFGCFGGGGFGGGGGGAR